MSGNQNIVTTIESCQSPANQGYSILDLDVKYFCGSSTATLTEKIEVVSALLEIFVEGKDEPKTEEGSPGP